MTETMQAQGAADVPHCDWEWFGMPAHFICGDRCRFHMATRVGRVLVSTVGAYEPDAPVREILAESRGLALEGRGDARLASWRRQVGFEEIGCGRTFETMVFHVGAEPDRCTEPACQCGQPQATSWSEIDSDAYNTIGDATRGHLAMCEKWATAAQQASVLNA